jgi:hypothetical protein
VPLPDRVAGLLLLLYAQSAADIASLTTGHIRDHGTSVAIILGTTPIALPESLAGLVRDLAATRRGHAAIGRPRNRSVAIPRRPSRPPTQRHTPRRPAEDHRPASTSGPRHSPVHPRHQIPAAILDRMLGIHIRAAVHWQKAD